MTMNERKRPGKKVRVREMERTEEEVGDKIK